jgi:four helix bundle protein
MTEIELKQRTQNFALRILRLVEVIPRTISGQVIAKQLIRSATSVGANYRAACRGRSTAEFAAKLSIVIEEADESAYWLELIMKSELLRPVLVENLYDEANQLVAIMVASRKSALKNK